jgi:hypothetical protein
MTDNSKLISEWQQKIQQNFGEEGKLYEYLTETLENFFYRYLETTEDKGLKVRELAPRVLGARSRESQWREILKINNPLVKPSLLDEAKANPRASGAKTEYELSVEVKELSAQRGELMIKAIIRWDGRDFSDPTKCSEKKILFTYNELSEFRKKLALRLEEACEYFN